MLTICIKIFHTKCRQNYKNIFIFKFIVTNILAIFRYFVILSAFCVKNLHSCGHLLGEHRVTDRQIMID